MCAGDGELIFTSERPVIAWLLLGSLKALTRMLYNVNVHIKIEPVEGDSRRYRYLFTIADETVATTPVDVEPVILESKMHRGISTNAEDLKIDMITFCKQFPWHFIMNENLELVQLGKFIFIIYYM